MPSKNSSIRHLIFSAFRAGGLRSVLLRSSAHSHSGVVLVAVFGNRSQAAAFARRWSVRLGLSVFVRRHPGGFAVSVPVSLPSSRPPSGFGKLLAVRGGVRGLVSLLGFSGLGVC